MAPLAGLDYDEGVRMELDRRKLWFLKPAFREDGRITAGNSSQISDGASAVLLASEQGLKRHGLTPRGRIVNRVVVGDDPVLMLAGPIPATRKALERAGLRLSDMDAVEINRRLRRLCWPGLRNWRPIWRRLTPGAAPLPWVTRSAQVGRG